jgi:hypothetical protein
VYTSPRGKIKNIRVAKSILRGLLKFEDARRIGGGGANHSRVKSFQAAAGPPSYFCVHVLMISFPLRGDDTVTWFPTPHATRNRSHD